MTKPTQMRELLQSKLADMLQSCEIKNKTCVIEVAARDLKAVCLILRDDAALKFECLMDVAGVDYSLYGQSQWDTRTVTSTGFSRGVDREMTMQTDRPRFAVVYQLLSVSHNHRIMLRTYAIGEPPVVDSVVDIWPSANWNEREVFDLFGILFRDHPDLRRILTDYGFIGHPFRKDFPLSGKVEVRYDATQGRVVYEPVDIQPRVLVPRVIRNHEADLNLEQETMND